MKKRVFKPEYQAKLLDPLPKGRYIPPEEALKEGQDKPMKAKERDLDSHQFSGAVDGGSNWLRCSACQALLLDVKVTRPDIPVQLSYRADCPHCGDHSWFVTVQGGVQIGCSDEVMYVNAEEDPNDSSKIYLRTKKGQVSPHHEVD